VTLQYTVSDECCAMCGMSACDVLLLQCMCVSAYIVCVSLCVFLDLYSRVCVWMCVHSACVFE